MRLSKNMHILHSKSKKKIAFVGGVLAFLNMPVQAQELRSFEATEYQHVSQISDDTKEGRVVLAEWYMACKAVINKKNYEEGYEVGKFHARAFQTALNKNNWSDEEKQYLDVSRFTSRHGIGGMTTGAQLLIAMMMAKNENKAWSPDSKTSTCLQGEFSIYKEKAWSAVHSGFTDHLSPELKDLYFSLPKQ